MFLVEAPLVVRFGDASVGCTPDLDLYHEDGNGEFLLVDVDGVKKVSVKLVEWKSGSVTDGIFSEFNEGNHVTTSSARPFCSCLFKNTSSNDYLMSL